MYTPLRTAGGGFVCPYTNVLRGELREDTKFHKFFRKLSTQTGKSVL